MKKIVLICFAVFVIGLGIGIFFPLKGKIENKKSETQLTESKYISFISEAYDIVRENYWNKQTEDQINNYFVLGIEKLTGLPQATKIKNKQELLNNLDKVMNSYDFDDKKKQFSTTLVDMVLANLEPFGRSRLYTQKEETDLNNNVSNKNPDVDQYQVLKIDKSASVSAIKESYEKESKKWDPKINKDPSAKQNYEAVQQAYKVLSDQESKKVYDISGVEPTIEYKLINPKVFYMHLTKFSPTTFDEMKRISEKVDKGDVLDSLILDLRDNIGGAIDGLPYFLGPFIGNNQYAYQFLHQGQIDDYKTRIGWVESFVRYKKVIILINENTQSTAEVMASVLKKYNVGILIGNKTKGWGTVEKVFSMKQQIDPKEKYSIFLVHTLTLREDGKTIQDNGVEPVIDLNNKNWEKEVNKYYNSPEIINAVKEVL